jgi:hypothetical protein
MYGDGFTTATPSLPVTAPPDVPRAPPADPAKWAAPEFHYDRLIDADGKIFGTIPWRSFAIGIAQSAAAGLLVKLLILSYTGGKSQ